MKESAALQAEVEALKAERVGLLKKIAALEVGASSKPAEKPAAKKSAKK